MRKPFSAQNHGQSPLLALMSASLREMPATGHYRVAYSGGADSHALLYGMAALGNALGNAMGNARRDVLGGAEISAIHVNHGLHSDARDWAAHAARVCRDLGIPCRILQVDARPILGKGPGEGPEAAARRARYDAIGEIMDSGDMLLTAHHQDDQAETLLLQMIRGAGPHGLAGMPRCIGFGSGWLGRPLLGVSRDVLRRYARIEGLHWIEDHSNEDTRFDRNYVRHEILARLRARWPGVTGTLARVAAHQARIAEQLDELAEADLATVGEGGEVLSCARLRRLPLVRQRNVLHAWFRGSGLPPPHAVHIERILNDVMAAAPDREPLVSWKGAEVRRYRDHLHAGAPLPSRGFGDVHDLGEIRSSGGIPWRLWEPLRLPHGRWEACRIPGQGLRIADCPDTVEVRFRQGGERCRIGAGGCTHRLKKLFQARGIPPWERERIPLVFIRGQLAAVAGLWVCHPFAAGDGEPGWEFRWFPDRG
uniref:tRNA(Ile)-lysidine synthase n=1 Tax=Candidatus Kentrum sp. LFY TaxID=2126342 RepID=A0A450WUY6_9GAMM|nr:MAG: tRNA(Ile)-lysidine synthase [Candidatus Kentron sp. LFY]